MRVPLIRGLPKQTAGLTAIRLRQSFLERRWGCRGMLAFLPLAQEPYRFTTELPVRRDERIIGRQRDRAKGGSAPQACLGRYPALEPLEEGITRRVAAPPRADCHRARRLARGGDARLSFHRRLVPLRRAVHDG